MNQQLSNSNGIPLVVGVGASAGGLEPFIELIDELADESRLAIVFVQHLADDGLELLCEVLKQNSSWPVELVVKPTALQPGSIYLCPPKTQLLFADSRLTPAACSITRTPPIVIDSFFQSLAENVGDRAAGVILSGAGSDGTLGMKAISDAGGLTFAQDSKSAKLDSMPRNAATTGVADFVLPPAQIASELIRFADYHDDVLPMIKHGTLPAQIEKAIPQISAELRKETDHNFLHYKRSTLCRRIARRMQVLKISQVDAYVARLQSDSTEVHDLFRELLISVTTFFRDTEAFDVLRRETIPAIFAKRDQDKTVRIWCPGCATGEEAFTIAIICREYMESKAEELSVQIFASDIDDRALGIARQGIYPSGIAEQVPTDLLNKYFVQRGKQYQIIPRIREMVLFSLHNLISDPPFSRQDLISCRNLLIYLGPHLQKKLIPLFHYALRPNGYLFLGPSESIAQHADLFRMIDSKHRISQRKGTAVGGKSCLSIQQSGSGTMRLPEPESSSETDSDIVQIMQRIVLDEFSPRAVVIDEKARVLCSSADVAKYLSTGEGTFENNVIKMARRGLKIGLRATLLEAKKRRRRITHEDLSVQTDHGKQRVMITVQPMMRLGEDSGLFMVVFHDVGLPLPPPGDAPPSEALLPTADTAAIESAVSARGNLDRQADAMIETLERELEATRNDLDQSMQEMESANEELKSSNEELLSMNEELQSANEELETSKEEIRQASQAIERANDDLENLLRGTQIATVFLDEDLSIRSFTPAITKIYGLIPTDIGRPLTQIAPNVLDMPRLPDPASLSPTNPDEHTVIAKDGRAYLRRVLRYQSRGSLRNGVVVTFTDVTEIQESEMRLAKALDATSNGAWDWNIQTGEIVFSQRWIESLGYSTNEITDAGRSADQSTVLLDVPEMPRTSITAGLEFLNELVHPGDLQRLNQTRNTHFAGENDTFICKYRLRRKSGDYRWNLGRGQVIQRDQDGAPVRMVGTDTDITEQYLSQKLVQESQQRLRLALDAAGMGTFSWNRETDELHFDLQLCDIWGLPEQTTQIGTVCFQAVHPDDLPLVKKELNASYEEGRDYEVSFRIVRPNDGEIRSIGGCGQWIADNDGTRRRLVGLNWDQTDEKQREAELVESRRQLQLGVEVANLCLGEVDYDSGQIHFSADAAKLYGLGDEPTTRNRDEVHQLFHPNDSDRIETLLKQCLDPTSKTKFSIEHRIILPDGKIRWIEVHKQIVFHDDPFSEKPRRAILAARNISRRKETETAVRLNEERLRLATVAAGVATFYVDAITQTVQWSEELHRIIGQPMEQPAVVSFGEVPAWIYPDDRDEVREFIARVLSDVDQSDHELTHRIVRSDGSVRHVRMQTRSIYEGTENQQRVILVAGALLDITQQHENEQQLEAARQAAVQANEQKSAFVANLSHEIRTPMTAILGYADIVRERVDDTETLVHLDTIRRNGDYLLEIINDILDLSKIEAGKFELDKEPFDPAKVVEDVRSIMEVRAVENDLILEVQYATRIPKLVQSDAKRLKQILINLVGNGIKFTPQGKVSLRVSYDDKLRFEVIDTGIGMTDEQRSKLFRPFEQGDSSVSRHFGGTGLGLAISRRLAKMLGGEITVDSELHIGSTFTVEIAVEELPQSALVEPKHVAEKEVQASQQAASLALKCHVLVVDDRRDIRFLSKRLLTKAGATVDEAEDGQAAVDYVRDALASAALLDVVIMDMQMPKLDGYQAAKKLRDLGYRGSIIALTADAMQGDMNKCLEAGCNDYLSKPIDAPKLLEMVQRMTSMS